MKRKVLSTLLILATLIVTMICMASPAAALTEGDYEYDLITSGTEVRITKYVGPGGDVYIPKKIDGKPVTAIGEGAFKNNTAITSVWMSDDVRTMGKMAFSDCTALKSVELSDGLTELPSKNYSYDRGVFQGCTSLETVDTGNGLKKIAHYSFADCNSLNNVILGTSITNINEYAFANCTSLVNIEFPDTLTFIGEKAFNNCILLSEINLPDSLKTIGNYAFSGLPALKSVNFGKNLSSMGIGAFSECTVLKSIDLPDSLLTLPSKKYSYDKGAFQGCTSLESVDTGDGMTSIAQYAFADCISLKDIRFGDNILSINDHAFANCQNITSPNFNTNLRSIGEKAFVDCNQLSVLSFPDSLNFIGNYAFDNLASITNIKFGEGLKTVGIGAFSNCTSIKSIVLPDATETFVAKNYSYDEGVFQGCTSLETVVIGSSMKTVQGYAFADCVSLKEITFGNNVTTIGTAAFANCTKVKTLNLPDSLVTIGSYAFADNPSLQTIYFGNGLKAIGVEAFRSSTSLKHLVFPDSLETISVEGYSYSKGAFQNCTSLESVYIGTGMKNITKRTFIGCTSLKTVVIGQNVTTLDTSFVEGCTSLKNVYFLGNAPEMGEIGATLYSRPDATGFQSGNISSTYITVTLDANGGKTVYADGTSDTVYTKFADGGKITIPLNPTREGYTFLGWYQNKDGSGKAFDFNNDSATKNITLYAKWEVNTYRIFFDPRGGKVSIGGKTVTYGEEIGSLPIPALDSDAFDGWYPGMNSSGPEYTSKTKMPAKDIILYAGWENNDSATTVIFDTHGGNYIAPVDASNNKIISAPADPVRDGYDFVGWYMDAGYDAKFNFGSIVTSNTTLHALWKKSGPAAPKGLTNVETASSWIVIKWSASEGADGYNVYANGKLMNTDLITKTEYTITGLDPATTYTIKITAVNEYGEGKPSDTITAITPELTQVYGDADGNLKVNLADVSTVLKYIAKWDVKINTKMADVNLDSKVNLSDVSMILKAIAKWDIVLGK